MVCGRCSQALVSLEPHTCPPGFLNLDSNHPTPGFLKSASSDHLSTSQPTSDAGPLVGFRICSRFQLCFACSEIWIKISGLQRNLVTHDESSVLRRFKCSDCGKAFKFKHHLKVSWHSSNIVLLNNLSSLGRNTSGSTQGTSRSSAASAINGSRTAAVTPLT